MLGFRTVKTGTGMALPFTVMYGNETVFIRHYGILGLGVLPVGGTRRDLGRRDRRREGRQSKRSSLLRRIGVSPADWQLVSSLFAETESWGRGSTSLGGMEVKIPLLGAGAGWVADCGNGKDVRDWLGGCLCRGRRGLGR